MSQRYKTFINFPIKFIFYLGIQHKQSKALVKIEEENQYERRMQIYKQDAVYAKERAKELEEKTKDQEVQIKVRFERIVNLAAKVKSYKVKFVYLI